MISSRLPWIGALAALGLYGWVSVQVYRAQADPQDLHERPPIFGPRVRVLNREAQRHIRAGMGVLNDVSLPPAERIESYRAELRTAEALLVQSMRTQPVQARPLSWLAAVRWELNPPLTEDSTREYLKLAEAASRMAPGIPEVQLRIGELVMKMGRREEALDYLIRSLDLDPDRSKAVIGILEAGSFSAREMLEALPRRPETLIALQQPFLDEGTGSDYLDAVDEALQGAPSLWIVYADTCLLERDPERLLRRMDDLGPGKDPPVEAERRLQRSRALLALGRTGEALEDARRAVSLQPGQLRFLEHLGDLAMSASLPEEAAEAFRLALARAARGSNNPSQRARLYSKIGQALDLQGKAHLAYDAYKKALGLNPEQAHAKRRIAEMEDAAGVRGSESGRR